MGVEPRRARHGRSNPVERFTDPSRNVVDELRSRSLRTDLCNRLHTEFTCLIERLA